MNEDAKREPVGAIRTPQDLRQRLREVGKCGCEEHVPGSWPDGQAFVPFTPPGQPTCRTCRFGFCPRCSYPNEIECRRRAPVVVNDGIHQLRSEHPRVHRSHWCGEYEADPAFVLTDSVD